jgi:tetratricopeptide (TPR) repeat protein
MLSRILAVFIVLLACCRAHAGHGPNPGSPEENEKLGTVSFPISCDPSVQKSFERGVALLHSFEFEQSDLQFQEIARQDPRCAMAFWGQAMSIYHQLWTRPTAVDLRDGLALVREAQRLRAGSERDRAYIDALAMFYGNYRTVSHGKRVAAYAKAMEKVYRQYPEDREAAVWYALALLALGDDEAGAPNQKRAISLLQDLLPAMPEHPGVAHYLIHACDEPRFARLGLEAARKYAAIAASSPHAVHMPSHIFARLGLWQDDIKSNLAALAVAQEQGAHAEVAHHQLHAMDFLEYAYLQIGDDRKAKAIVDEALALATKAGPEAGEYQHYAFVEFPVLLALETRQWKTALTLKAPAGIEPYNRAIVYWAHAVAAGHLRDVPAAQLAVTQYNAMVQKTRRSSTPYEADTMDTDHDEAQAWVAFARGRNEEALKLMRAVADDQDSAGKGEVELPAREMLADMLLELQRPEEALAEYEKSLTTDPNRFNGLYGAARAAELAHLPEKAAQYYAQLLENCAGSDSDRPELAQARMEANR